MSKQRPPRPRTAGAATTAAMTAPSAAPPQPPPLPAGADAGHGPAEGEDDESSQALEPAEMIGDKYRLEHRLARGGMGAVWQGWDTALDRPVAIKFMARSIARSKSLRARFDREAKAAAKLRTPYVVQIYEHGVHGELPYMVLELLEGEDLHDRLERVRRLAPAELAPIVVQTARGLRRAHAKGIVHRDLKPRNIFLARDDDEEQVKILDFGIAKNVHDDDDGDTTKTGQLLGSPAYMSPEQARGHRAIDHRTDLWSLAVILWKCLTGQSLFRGKTSGDVIVKICTDPLPRLSEVLPGFPEPFDHFFAKALARDPDLRFQSASDLAEAYAAALRATDDQALIHAAPPPGDRVSSEWTPISDVTPSDSGGTHPSLASGVVQTPELTPPPVSGPGSTPAAMTDGSPAPATPPPRSGLTSLDHPTAISVDDEQPAPRRRATWIGAGVLLIGAAAIAGGLLVAIAGGLLVAGDDDETAAMGAATAIPDDRVERPPPVPRAPAATGAPATGADEGNGGGAAAGSSAEPAAAIHETRDEAATTKTPTPAPSPTRRPPSRPRPAPTKTPTPKGRWGY